MSAPIISVENVSKRYIVGHRNERGDQYSYVALRDVLAQEMRNAARKAVDVVRGRQVLQGDTFEEFWALRDVNFEVQQGEVLGIIGRNGAGKSTLLKLLSRITEPTTGRITLRGRVASLLEVGTGFHPELTGRENIYLNGAILGMARAEIRKKFDEIVAFSEVERFLDTPVKRYSSGMYVRLAFAVAAHLEPEILIIDEVLAVGDAGFQKKCLGKMEQVSSEGRTVLFVSHNMNSVIQLTKRAVVLSGGKIIFIGGSENAVDRYASEVAGGQSVLYDVSNTKRSYHGTGEAKIVYLRFNRAAPRFEFDEPINFSIGVFAREDLSRLRASMTVHRKDGSPVGTSFSNSVVGIELGKEYQLNITLPSSRLTPGSYYCDIGIGKGDHHTGYINYDGILETLFFEVLPERTESGGVAQWPPSWGAISFGGLSAILDNVSPGSLTLAQGS